MFFNESSTMIIQSEWAQIRLNSSSMAAIFDQCVIVVRCECPDFNQIYLFWYAVEF